MNIILTIIFALLGFLFWNTFAGKYEGDKIERSFRFSIRNYKVHIHHWVWAIVLLLVLIFFHVFNSIIIGLLIGSIVQGLTYKDRFVFFYRGKDFERIYSKWKK